MSVSKEIARVSKLYKEGRFLEVISIVKKMQRLSVSPAAQAVIDKMLDLSYEKMKSMEMEQLLLDRDRKPKQVIFGYCILLMEHEKHVTCMTVSSLLQQLSSQDRVFLLFNGFRDRSLCAHFEKHANVTCVESPRNLGVAGGRNVLYEKALDGIYSVEYLVTLDNDVLIPVDFNERVKKVVAENYQQLNLGVIGGVIFDYKNAGVREYIENEFLCFKGYLGVDCYNIFSDDLLDFLKKSKGELKKVLWHIGMHPDYKKVYIDRDDLSDESSFQPFLAHSDVADDLLSKDSFSVSNVPGCFQVFSKEHLQEVGMLEEKFSPYFFEDSEFCVRSILAGKKNLIFTSIFLLHGTDDRHVERKKDDKKFLHLMNEFRARYVFLDKIKEMSPLNKLLSQADKVCRNRATCSIDERKYVAALEGIQKGINQCLGSSKEQKELEKLRVNLPQKNVMSFLDSPVVEKETVTFSPGLPSCNDSLPRVYFNRLKKFRNIYEGQEAIIICNGPSLKRTRLGLFRHIPSFAVNSTFILQESLGFVPSFYTVEDNHVVADNLSQILSLDAGVKFFPEKYREMLGDAENVFYLPTSWDCYFKSKVSYEYPEFSRDIARAIYTGQTVTYLNLQIAHYLGFERVYIVGLDFSYSIPKGSKIDHNSIDHDDDDPNHFHPSYFGKGKQWHFPKLDSCMTSYSIAREEYELSGRQVIDLTIDGKLNTFKKSSVADVIPFANDVPLISEGLEFEQYVLDSIASVSFRHGKKAKYSFSSEEIESFLSSNDENVYILLIKNDDEFNAYFKKMVKDALYGWGGVLIYIECGYVIFDRDGSIFSELPYANWLDSTVNNHYLNMSEFDESLIPNGGGVLFELYEDFLNSEKNIINYLMEYKARTLYCSDYGFYINR